MDFGACLPLEHDDRKKGQKRGKTAERFYKGPFAMVLCLLAFAISTRLPSDTEKQMLSVCLSQTFISFPAKWRLCPCELCVHLCACVLLSDGVLL